MSGCPKSRAPPTCPVDRNPWVLPGILSCPVVRNIYQECGGSDKMRSQKD